MELTKEIYEVFMKIGTISKFKYKGTNYIDIKTSMLSFNELATIFDLFPEEDRQYCRIIPFGNGLRLRLLIDRGNNK